MWDNEIQNPPAAEREQEGFVSYCVLVRYTVHCWYVCLGMSAELWLVLVRFVEGEEEGVGHAFAGDVGAWAVAGEDGD